ncbi:transcription termination factor MTERF8, chloroplastic-like [Typha angustifolia]|uniref:transcription termination factor MTERF8, chloroplastic-like n=1 Tax=Typha angustifolia TaxID=59011 RepID=UPI003C2CA8FF
MPLQTSRLLSISLLRHGKARNLSTRILPISERVLFLPFSTAAAKKPPPNLQPMSEYLVSNCGFTSSEATKVSKQLSHLKSTQKPDSVLRFLHLLGLNQTNIKNIVTWCPRILTADVDKTIKPKLQSIRDLGFSDSEIAELITANPSILRLTTVISKIEYLRLHLPAKADLLKALKRDPTLLHSNLAETVVRNSALLQEHGLPESKISAALIKMPWLLTRKADSFRELVDYTVSLGVPHDSKMFLYALHAISRISKETFRVKFELMKSFGWSEDNFYAAFRKAPNFLTRSNEKLRIIMSFLVNEVGLEAGYVAEHPMFLMFSFEKRLLPRHKVHQILKSEGLAGANLLSIVYMPEFDVIPHIRSTEHTEFHQQSFANAELIVGFLLLQQAV